MRELVHAAFVPFGDITNIIMPTERRKQLTVNKGFALVEYDFETDAAAAIDNMDEAELAGKVVRVQQAKTFKVPMKSRRPCKFVWHGGSSYHNF